MYGAAPEFAQQNPSHSASDDGPNGGRACPRHPMTSNECDYGDDSSKAHFFPTRSNTVRSNRQKFALLISKGNFDDPRFARFSEYRHQSVDTRRLNRRAPVRSDVEIPSLPVSSLSLFAIDLGGRCTTQSWVVRTKWLAPQRAPAGLGLPPKPHIRRVEATRRWEQ